VKEQRYNIATTLPGQNVVMFYDFSKWRGSNWALQYNSGAADGMWDRVDEATAIIAKE
jgi:hypothetical protein